MKRDNETLQRIFEKTDCLCHICRKRLSFKNYGQVGARGAWEIEHSIPRSRVVPITSTTSMQHASVAIAAKAIPPQRQPAH